jgi:hypothetical protein
MKAEQLHVSDPNQLESARFGAGFEPQLALVFGSSELFRSAELGKRLRHSYPKVTWVGCSTAGEISNDGANSEGLLITGLAFEDPQIHVATAHILKADDSYAAGCKVGAELAASAPHTALVFAPGTNVNGSQLIKGLTSALPGVRIAGGLAGDGARFQQTFTLFNDLVAGDQLVVVGLSSPRLRSAFGSYGGWKPFGPARRVTKVAGNILYQLDSEPALAVYKRYLGHHSAELPASGLLFPFSILNENQQEVGLIRTILAVDEELGTLTLAGDVPHDGYLQLMHATTDSLVQGATSAAESARLTGSGQGFALLVSCVGRKLVMGGRTDEEVDAVVDTLGSQNVFAGFHSYGEISPSSSSLVTCDLYNQTMTVSFLRED